MPVPEVDSFASRHIGPSEAEVEAMLSAVGAPDLESLVAECVPEVIRLASPLELPGPADERSALAELRALADQNQIWRSFIGAGYHGTVTPPVILRNILENPGWYTAYTPYQAEISQGRLEALLVYQTMVQELCGLDIANASLLDEATAAAEAMTMAYRLKKHKLHTFYVADDVHPQTLAVVRTRAEPLGIKVVVGPATAGELPADLFGVLLQYPATDGTVHDLSARIAETQAKKALSIVATDLLALCLLKSPGSLGADIAIGSSQRFGVPMGYGGPHAAFIACRQAHRRQLPGRLIGVSVDSHGNPALRMALQTREQHIRRKKATSNICTAQVLLAVVAAMYAVWHGPEGLTAIAARVHGLTRVLQRGLEKAGYDVGAHALFDTVRVHVGDRQDVILDAAATRQINLRLLRPGVLTVALDETTGLDDLADLFAVFGVEGADVSAEVAQVSAVMSPEHRRETRFMTDAVFHEHRSETAMLRYLHSLESRDLSLTTSMIPLGSCTMKLNATTEMIPVTWPEFGALHPFAPREQAAGYTAMFEQLETWLAEITGFAAVSLQPNAGSQGEYAGLLTIRRAHLAAGAEDRDICLIPTSAHGTNPASAVMAGMKVVVVACDDQGNIDLEDLRAKADEHADRLGALMVTYPSTHGVFETAIRDICDVVHAHGGYVYMDGANMNAMVGLCRPGDFGADVCHLNLHKTFCIPHGGGGPGMGPIGCTEELAPHLPGHPLVALTSGDSELQGPVSAAPWGSPSILPITWAYIRMLGEPGLRRASAVAILNANYIAERLKGHYDVLYTGINGRVAHECILDTRPFKSSGVVVDDIAKRLMDFGFHAPTMSWPVVGTLMVEPTESESKVEIDRFVDALIAIRKEIQAVEQGAVSAEASVLRHAPHTAADLLRPDWDRPYTREDAAFPAPWSRTHKFWPYVGRVDNAYGDRHLICTCDAWPNTAG